MTQTPKLRTANFLITGLSKKGNGLAVLQRPDAQPASVEVPFTMPGDQIGVQLLRKRSGVFSAKLEEMIAPSQDRIPPRCVHFGVCGGCRFQHMDYALQLKHKEKLVSNCFNRLLPPGVVIQPILACEEPWHYRNKMEFSFSSDLSGKKYLGLIMDSSNGKVLNLTECHITNSWFIEALKNARSWWMESGLDAYYITKDKGSLRTLTVREGMRTGDRMVMLTVSGNPEYALQQRDLDSFIAYMRASIEPIDSNCNLSIVLRIHQIAKGMPTHMYEMILHGPDSIRETLTVRAGQREAQKVDFYISPSAFFQTNTVQAEKLYSAALSLMDIPEDAVVYDLYCGTGAMGLCIAKFVKEVVGVEISPESSLDARTNIKANKINNFQVFTDDVGAVLAQFREKKLAAPDLVMVDPPRPGLDPKAIRHLVDLKPAQILYVSCNPLTQAANIESLMQQGYKIKAVQPIDQFAQTYHVENIVLLSLC